MRANPDDGVGLVRVAFGRRSDIFSPTRCPPMSQESLDQWLDRLNAGDVEAVERVFEAYEPYLRIAVRRRLSARLRSKVDSADIVQSVFADMVRGVRDGGWHFAG